MTDPVIWVYSGINIDQKKDNKMLPKIAGTLMVASGLVHLGMVFGLQGVAGIMMFWGVLYTIAGMTQLRGIRIGSWMTIVFVLLGAGSSAYGVVAQGKEPPPFGEILLLAELVAVACSAVYLYQTRQAR